MSWSQSTDDTARDLARVLVTGGGVREPDLDVALTARAAAVDLAATVTGGVRGAGNDTDLAHRQRVGDLDADPVRLFAQLLAAQPHLPRASVALTETLQEVGITGAGQAWRGMARHATVAAHEWSTAYPASGLPADAQWSAVARVAALTEGVLALTPDLAASAAAAGRPEIAQSLTGAAWSGLASTARAVQDLAARGPLPEVELTAPATRAVLPVRSLADLAPAAERLRHLVATTESLTPKDLQLVAGVHARTSATAARLLAVAAIGPAAPRLRPVVQGLARHARDLTDAVQRPRRVEGLYPGDPRPLAQAAEINRFVSSLTAGKIQAPSGRHAGALVEFAKTAPEATAALADAAREQLAARRWVVPAGEHHGRDAFWATYDFVVPTAITPTPPLVTALDAAVAGGRDLADAARVARPPAAVAAAAVAGQGTSGAKELAAALAAHRTAQAQTRTRPAYPAQAAGYRPPVPVRESAQGPER